MWLADRPLTPATSAASGALCVITHRYCATPLGIEDAACTTKGPEHRELHYLQQSTTNINYRISKNTKIQSKDIKSCGAVVARRSYKIRQTLMTSSKVMRMPWVRSRFLPQEIVSIFFTNRSFSPTRTISPSFFALFPTTTLGMPFCFLAFCTHVYAYALIFEVMVLLCN